jgi:hypothetical protein
MPPLRIGKIARLADYPPVWLLGLTIPAHRNRLSIRYGGIKMRIAAK